MAGWWLAAWFGLVLLAVGLTVWQQRDGSFQVAGRAHELVFRSRFPLGFVVLLLGIPALCFLQVSSARAGVGGRLLLGLALGGALVFVLGRLVLIESLTLNTKRFTYRLHGAGLPGLRGRKGSCHDLAGVYVREWHSSYRVGLIWRGGRYKRIWLGVYASRERAEALAAEVAEAAGLLVIDPPPLDGRR